MKKYKKHNKDFNKLRMSLKRLESLIRNFKNKENKLSWKQYGQSL